ncbi:MAG: lipoprotein [Butyricicoccus sp.]
MKKLFAMLLAVGCMTGLTACGGGTSDEGGTKGTESKEYTVQTYNTDDLTDEQKKAVIGSLEYEAPESELGDVSVNRVLAVDDYLVALYPELDDTDAAVEKVSDTCSKVLKFLKKQYDLEDFSEESCENYQNAMWDCFDDGTELPDWYTDENDQFLQLDEFYDLYENTSINDDLIAQAEQMGSMTELLSNSDFMYSLPEEDGQELIAQYTEANGSEGVTNPYTAWEDTES